MISETQHSEYPYILKIETSTGQCANVPIAFLKPTEIESFLQFDFKRLVEEAGLKGVRIHVERAMAADYEKILGEVAAYLRKAATKAA